MRGRLLRTIGRICLDCEVTVWGCRAFCFVMTVCFNVAEAGPALVSNIMHGMACSIDGELARG